MLKNFKWTVPLSLVLVYSNHVQLNFGSGKFAYPFKSIESHFIQITQVTILLSSKRNWGSQSRLYFKMVYSNIIDFRKSKDEYHVLGHWSKQMGQWVNLGQCY